MTLCQFTADAVDPLRKTCAACGVPFPVPIDLPPHKLHRRCDAPPFDGVGTRLKRLFAAAGIIPDGKRCNCAALAARMDRRGPDWCAAHIDEIVGEMRANARKLCVPLFNETAARWLVRRAIRQTRKAQHAALREKSQSAPPAKLVTVTDAR